MIFKPTTPEKVAAQQLYEAQREILEHQAAQEFHASMVQMYEARIKRLQQAGDKQ